MEGRLQEIRKQLWEEPSQRELHIMELEEQIGAMEPRVQALVKSLPDAERILLEGYLYALSELELYTVTQEYKRGRELGEQIGRNYHKPLY